MKNVQESILAMLRERSARKYLALAVCMIAVLTVVAVFWTLRISGITLSDGGSATSTDAMGATETDAETLGNFTEESESAAASKSVSATDEFNGLGIAAAVNSDDSGIATVSEDDFSGSYYFADLVELSDATSNPEDDYIIYTVIDNICYVVSADGSLVAATAISGTGDAETEGLYTFVSSGNRVFDCLDAGSTFESYRWTLTDSGTTGSYYIQNNASGNYLALSTAETLTGTAWWDGTDTGNRYEMSGNGLMIFTVVCTDGSYAAFNVEVYDNNGYYITTGSDGNAWYAGGASGYWADVDTSCVTSYYSGLGIDTELDGSQVASGDTYTVTVLHSGSDVVITYYDADSGEEVATYSAYSTNLDSDLNIHFMAQVGTFEVSALYATDAVITKTTTGTEIDLAIGDFTATNFANGNVGEKTLDSDGGDEALYTFTNTMTGSDIYDNFTVEVLCGGQYLDLRADSGRWITGFISSSNSIEITSVSTDTYGITGVLDNDYDSSGWIAAMQAGSDCTVRVVRTENESDRTSTFTFYYTIADSAGTVFLDFEAEITDSVFYAQDATVKLIGEYCTLTDIAYADYADAATSWSVSYTEGAAVIAYNRISDTAAATEVRLVSSTDTAGWTGTVAINGKTMTLLGEINSAYADTVEWQNSDSTKVTGVAGDSGTSVSATFYFARVREYTAHFDPTNGGTSNYGNSRVYYYASSSATKTTAASATGSYAITSWADADGNCYVLLPSAAFASRYTYALQGWYDIYNNKYYAAPTSAKPIQIEGHTVFYADWIISSSYQSMDGTEGGALSEDNKLDTTSFITTKVFDYNDLFNLYSANQTDSASGTNTYGTATYVRTLNAASHAELWQLAYGEYNNLGAESIGFLFLNNRAGCSAYQVGLSLQGSLSYQINRNGNGYNAGYRQGIATEIYSNTGYDLRTILFSEDADYNVSSGSGYLGVNYLGTGNYLYQYDSTTGYYYYDSAKNAAYYYNDRFYLFEYTVMGSGTGTEDDFLPFNYPTATSSTDGEGNMVWIVDTIGQAATNYWFGLSSTIDFYLPDTIGSEGANQTISGDMVFKFSGDDDVWVYVDGILLLDLGGTHDKVYGEINFSTGTVTIVNDDYYSASVSKDENGVYHVSGTEGVETYTFAELFASYALIGDSTATTTYEELMSSGAHQLTMYYMERGASQSNLAVYTSVSPMYSLTLTKEDYSSGSTLTGAAFTVYTSYDFDDSDNSITASLLTSLTGGTYTDTFAVDDDGTFTIYGLRPNQTYYLVETAAPGGYPLIHKVLRVVVDSTGNATVTVLNSDGGTLGTEYYAYESKTNTTTLSTNEWQFLKVGSVTVTAGTAPSEGDDYNVAFTVTNDFQYELPYTGGMGTDRYLLPGKILVLTAAIGLMTMAFYQLVRVRKRRTGENRKEHTKEKKGGARRFARTRDHPRQRSAVLGHARDRPGTGK